MCKFTSPTWGEVDFKQMVEIMRKFYNANKHYGAPFNIIVGTDSQNHSDTRMVSAVVCQCEGHGGIYFYRIEHMPKIKEVRQKLNQETQLSLQYANEFLDILAETDEGLFASVSFSIHIDAGRSDDGGFKWLIDLEQ